MSTISIDTRQFKAALQEYRETTKRELRDILNQRAFNIAGRTMDALKPEPGNEKGARHKIKNYMDAMQGSPRLKMFKTGRRRGQLALKGGASGQLRRKHLILQARRKKMGMKGLYGKTMREQVGKFTQAAQVGVGFLKSPFIPIIKGLHDLVRFKSVKTAWGRISVWPGSDGFGKVTPAKKSTNPFVEMRLKWIVSGHAGKVNKLIVPKMQSAFDAEAAELRRYVTEKLQAEANKIKPRK
jgi:hypothetical protein